MTKKNTTPAFPTTTDNAAGGGSSRGMTLRDYFAATVMQGLAPGLAEALSRSSRMAESMIGRAACLAYGIADAMIAERDRVDKIPE